jgi:hypothetical protein
MSADLLIFFFGFLEISNFLILIQFDPKNYIGFGTFLILIQFDPKNYIGFGTFLPMPVFWCLSCFLPLFSLITFLEIVL